VKKADTWMPFYVGDYLADTMLLTTVQHGAYLLLMLACWKSGGSLPDDDEALSSAAKLSASEWRKNSGALRRFFEAKDGALFHKRITQELEKAQNLSDARRESGKKGGRPAKAKQDETNRFPDALAKAKQNETPSPSHTSSLRSEVVLSAEANASSSSSEPTPKGRAQVPCPFDAIVSAYHQQLPMLPKVRLMDEKRKGLMRKRWAWVLNSTKSDGTPRASTGDEAIAWFVAFFGRASASAWLTGQSPGKGHEGWKADLEFLMTDKGLKAVIERIEAAA
jgi:uncharacterized protein YdaU (DUF1376 family)